MVKGVKSKLIALVLSNSLSHETVADKDDNKRPLLTIILDEFLVHKHCHFPLPVFDQHSVSCLAGEQSRLWFCVAVT